MKHWDLIPGERVRIARGPDSFDPKEQGAPATFLFRTTMRAVFEMEEDESYREFALLSNGELADPDLRHRRFHVAGEQRHTRTILEEPLGGEYPNFSRVTPERTRKITPHGIASRLPIQLSQREYRMTVEANARHE